MTGITTKDTISFVDENPYKDYTFAEATLVTTSRFTYMRNSGVLGLSKPHKYGVANDEISSYLQLKDGGTSFSIYFARDSDNAPSAFVTPDTLVDYIADPLSNPAVTMTSYIAADDPYWTVSWEGVTTGTVAMTKADSKAMFDTTVPFIIAGRDDYATITRGVAVRPDCK
jgi:hypothetical protein